MNPVTLIIGIVILAASVFAIARVWRRPKGRRVTQRWRVTFLATGGAIVGCSLALPAKNPTVSIIWVWTVVILVGLIFVGWTITGCVDLVGAAKARAREVELGVPPTPQPATFTFAFIALTFALGIVFMMTTLPWVFITTLDAAPDRQADSGQSIPATSYAPDDRLFIALWIALGAAAVIAAAIAGGRVLVQRRRINDHQQLTAGIQSQLRGAYEAGYTAGSTGAEYRPNAPR